MSSVRIAMCWQLGEQCQSRYSWIWLFFLPVAGLVDRELDPAVADPELDVVDPLEGQEIGGLGVGVQSVGAPAWLAAPRRRAAAGR